ncbi:MAG TPA: helix-turn-helix domain-containing protein [Chitinophagaceae bacterium]|nr:helix-turn-helix domain-containing protein [Chitinophagaceae bacterium]
MILNRCPRHIEFFDPGHFSGRYFRVAPAEPLRACIDFFWETDFDSLWESHPQGFSDVLFPHVGYTYLINLANPFVMQVGEKRFGVRRDVFLPRPYAIECHHQPGNRLFGIKFRVAPLLLEKRIDFSEYLQGIVPLGYLIDREVPVRLKQAGNFAERVALLNRYFLELAGDRRRSVPAFDLVSSVLNRLETEQAYRRPVPAWAADYGISTRTLQRYFEMATGISTKTALQILRIRRAVQHLATCPGDFHYAGYGYYDYSHFCRHLRSFLRKRTLDDLRPHLRLLEPMRR